MSRTYRYRHLPMGGHNRARKIVDGNAGSWRRRREKLAAEIEKIVGFPEPSYRAVLAKGGTHREWVEPKYKEFLGVPWLSQPGQYVTLPGRWVKSYERWLWDWWDDKLERETIWPVSSYHGYAQHPNAGSHKKFFRVLANRSSRHRTRQILQSQIIDDDWKGHFPHRCDYFDWWSIY